MPQGSKAVKKRKESTRAQVRVSPPEPRLYSVSARNKRPLLDFITEALRQAGCRILYESEASWAPFRVTFETPDGERLGGRGAPLPRTKAKPRGD